MTGAGSAFAVFGDQDSGCFSYGVEENGERFFVKTARTPDARASLTRAFAFHAAVRHEAIVRPVRVLDGVDEIVLVYPWHDGTVLNHATVGASDRSGLDRFRTLPLGDVHDALAAILDAHLAVSAAGWVAVDLYDGCFLYDFAARRMRLIDFDEYRPGAFELATDRLSGSRRYMAPEEFTRGALIDERTTVHALGSTLRELLDAPDGWRGTTSQRAVVERATRPEPGERYPDVAALVADWRAA